MGDIIFTEAIAQQRIWGGTGLAEKFSVPFQCSLPGEIIAAAGFDGHDTTLRGKNQTLSQFYAADKDYFGLAHRCFPLAVNLIDARERLSVQVHPTEAYARTHENCCGLPEVWAVLAAADGAELVAGHSAATKEEFKRLASAGEWEQLLSVHPVEKGDCFIIPPGTVHAVGAGVQIYEVTHAADAVYRLYDYDRRDALSGKPRPLHLEKALDVIYAPQRIQKSCVAVVQSLPGLAVEVLVDLPRIYTVKRLTVTGDAVYSQELFGIYTVADGRGSVNGQAVRCGDTFIVSCKNIKLAFQGEMTIYMATFRE